MTKRRPVCVRWDDLDQETVRQGVTRSGFGNEHALIVRNVLEPGMEQNPHVHEFDQIALIVEGEARMHVDGEVYDMPAGSIMLIPAGATHNAEPVGDKTVVNLDVFSPPREDFDHLTQWMPTD
ncbi:MAG: cupin domain-containing protein [Acidimicrobiia bacterium]|nr:cupin domain-containing protein [Acidimicrobiia bacterium]